MESNNKTESVIIQKILMHLIPYLALLYTLNLLDRSNVSLAALTMQTDLSFSDKVYGLGAGMFFIGYFIFEVPSNIIMERVGARRWIARIMISWGIVSVCMMFIRTPFTFYFLRFLLGVAEAGFFPGIILYLTYWVPAKSRAKVISRFLFMVAMMGLAGGPLGGLLLKMNGFYGLAGWQWLFLVEGLPSVLLGFTVFYLLPNGPKEAKWLSDEEKVWIEKSLAEEGEEKDRVQHVSVKKVLSDRRIIHLCVIFILAVTGGNAIGFFVPKLLKLRSNGEWSDAWVATVGIIPALVGAIAMVVASKHSDRTGNRRAHIAWGYIVAGLAFVYLVFVPKIWGMLGAGQQGSLTEMFAHMAPMAWMTVSALALNALGERIAQGSYWALTSSTMGSKAAPSGIAFINSVGGLGGFIGPNLMAELLRRGGGDYFLGLSVATVFVFLAAYMALYLPHSTGGLRKGQKESEPKAS